MAGEFDFRDEPGPARRRQARGRGVGKGWLLTFAAIGVAVAVAVGYLAYDRLSDRHDRDRLDAIENREWPALYRQWENRGDVPESKDPEKKRLGAELDKLDAERKDIIRRHPEWRR